MQGNHLANNLREGGSCKVSLTTTPIDMFRYICTPSCARVATTEPLVFISCIRSRK